jgi:hypothetical protein
MVRASSQRPIHSGITAVAYRFAIRERIVGLFKVQRAVRHPRDDTLPPIPNDPAILLTFGINPGGHLARRPVRQRPGCPVLVAEGKAAPQLNGIDPEPLQHVLVHDASC